jgi:hypothetical protein
MVWGVLVIVVILLLVIVAMYNRLVRLRNRSENALGPRSTCKLRRRYDLIPESGRGPAEVAAPGNGAQRRQKRLRRTVSSTLTTIISPSGM